MISTFHVPPLARSRDLDGSAAFLDWITPFLLIYKKVVLFIFQPFISSDIRFHTHNTSIIRFISCAEIKITGLEIRNKEKRDGNK